MRNRDIFTCRKNKIKWQNKKNLQEVEYWGMERIGLALDRDRWWALVNALVKLRVP
jgi:hypothetical protein